MALWLKPEYVRNSLTLPKISSEIDTAMPVVLAEAWWENFHTRGGALAHEATWWHLEISPLEVSLVGTTFFPRIHDEYE